MDYDLIGKLYDITAFTGYHIYNWYCDRIDFYTHSGNEVLFIMMSEDPNGTYSANSKDTYEKFNALVGNIGNKMN